YLTSACVPARQAWMVPDRVSKTKFALPPVIGNTAGAPPNTMPVGPPATTTTSGGVHPAGTPAAVYSVDVLVASLDLHHGLPGPATSPQAFFRFGSTRSAAMAVDDETNGWTTYWSLAATAFPATASPATASTAA